MQASTGYALTGHLLGGTRNDYVNFSTFISNQIWCAGQRHRYRRTTDVVHASYGTSRRRGPLPLLRT